MRLIICGIIVSFKPKQAFLCQTNRISVKLNKLLKVELKKKKYLHALWLETQVYAICLTFFKPRMPCNQKKKASSLSKRYGKKASQCKLPFGRIFDPDSEFFRLQLVQGVRLPGCDSDDGEQCLLLGTQRQKRQNQWLSKRFLSLSSISKQAWPNVTNIHLRRAYQEDLSTRNLKFFWKKCSELHLF